MLKYKQYMVKFDKEMNNFDNRLKEIIDIMSVQDDYSTKYYLGLFKDSSFILFVRRFLEEKHDFDFCDLLRAGYRLCDIDYCVSLFCLEDLDLEEELLYPSVDFIFPKKEEVSIEKEAEEVTVKDSSYNFVIKFSSEELPFFNVENYINISSNYLDVKKIFFETENIPFVFEPVGDNIYEVVSLNKNLNKKTLLFDYDIVDNSSVSYVIKGEDELLFDTYMWLQEFFAKVYRLLPVLNLLQKKSSNFNEKSLFFDLKINRVFSDCCFITHCNQFGIFKLDDFRRKSLAFLSFTEINYILNELSNFFFESPKTIMWSLVKELEPREYMVLKERYLSDEVKTLETVGNLFGITRERIRQLEKRAIENLIVKKKKCKDLFFNLFLLSKFEKFITKEDLVLFDLPFGFFDLFEKVEDSFVKIEEFDVYSISNRFSYEYSNIINLLPESFNVNDFSRIIDSVYYELNQELTQEAIAYLINRIYDKYGDVYSRTKIKLGNVFIFLLEKYFPEGFDLYDDDVVNFLRIKAREHFDGFELADKDRAIRARIAEFCSPIGRGKWRLKQNGSLLTGAVKDNILSYIENYSVSIVPIQAVFFKFNKDLAVLGIDNKYYLQGELKKVIPLKYSVNRDYIFKGEDVNFYKLVENFVKENKKPVTKDEIKTSFPGITDITIQQVATATKVLNMNGYYVHLDNLNIEECEIINLQKAIDNVVSDNLIHHAKSIFVKVRKQAQGLFERIGINHYLQFYYFVNELYADIYEFQRPFVAKLGVEVIGGEAQVLSKMSGKNIVSISEIRDFAKEVGTIIDRYIEFINRNIDTYFFCNHNSVVNIEYLELSEGIFDNLDNVLEEFLANKEYRPLIEFFDYWKLPSLKIDWNEWLLYSIINKFSLRFNTAVSSNYLQEAVPILLAEDCLEENFSFIVNANNAKFTEELDILDIEDLL